MAESKALVKPDEAGAIAVVGTTLEALAHSLATGAPLELEIQDPALAAQAITIRILDAETDEQAFTPTGTVSGRELIGVPLEIHPPLRTFPSQFEGEGPPFFVVFNATRLDTGEAIAVSTSARNALAALVNGVKRDRFPGRQMMFWEPDHTTAAGYKPLWLVKTDYQGDGSTGPPADEEGIPY
jgi:hypothetical protein